MSDLLPLIYGAAGQAAASQAAAAPDVSGLASSAVGGAIWGSIGPFVGLAVLLSCLVLIGWAIFKYVIRPPAGGTIFDSKVSTATFLGTMTKPAISLGKAKTCQEEFGNTETDPKKKQFGFWDAKGLGFCWSCPVGYRVNVLPSVSDPNKCTQVVDFGQKANDSPATQHRAGLGPAGLTRPEDMKLTTQANNPNPAFLDPNGLSYICPVGTNRTASAVTAPDSCLGDCQKIYSATSTLGQPFEDSTSGRCYSCPTGFVRSAAAVTDPNACSQS